MQTVLAGGSISWANHDPASGTPWPSHQHVLVFISELESEMEEAADAAVACGYEHVAVLQGSLSAFEEAVRSQAGILLSLIATSPHAC